MSGSESESESELLRFVASVLTPGQQHPWALRIASYALVGLVAVLGLLIAVGQRTVHHFVLLGMSVALLAAIHWFMAELSAANNKTKNQKQKQKKDKAKKDE